MKQIIINPNLNIQYSAYYIDGLRQVFGKKNVTFAKKSQIYLFDKSGKYNFTFLVKDNDINSRLIKVVIDHSDFNSILDSESYKWADVYGKVNTNWEITPGDKYSKIVCLASNFGIRCFGFFESIVISIKNYLKVNPDNKRKFFAQYYKQNKKLWLKQYPLSKSRNNYIFSVHTLWYSDEWNRLDESTNKIRADFMETCLSMPQIDFEGGFVPSKSGNENYKNLHLKHRISHMRYIRKLRESITAFNTPAVWNCHGWKLSEFLCMGKAIISTPLSNDLPAPLVHGESIHYVKDKSELKDTVVLINKNIEYRKKLEKGARDYYEKYVSPESVIKLLGI